MSCKVLVDCFNRDYWEQCAKEFTDYNIYQTWPYQQIRADKSSLELSRFIVLVDNKLPVIMGHIRIKSFLNIKMGYIQSGPIIQNKHNVMENIHEAVSVLKYELMLQRKLHILRFNLNVWNDNKDLSLCFEKCGFETGKYYKKNKTFIVSLESTEDELLKLIHGDNRRLIRKADSLGLEIVVSTDDEYFPLLNQMYIEAKQRKGFSGIESSDFWNTQKNLSENERIELIVIKHENIPIAIHATSHLGNTAIPVLTVNSVKSLELNVSNYLFWQAYMNAKKRGMSFYDMGGYDETENPRGFLFKKRMGGEKKEFLPPFDYCQNRIVRYLWHKFSKKYYAS